MNPNEKLADLRLRRGISLHDVGCVTGLGTSNIEEIEADSGTLMSTYSPEEVNRLCQFYGVSLPEVFSDSRVTGCVYPEYIRSKILETCQLRGMTVSEFAAIVGWELDDIITYPWSLYRKMSLDGLRWICEELNIDWLSVLNGLAKQGTH